MPDARLFDDRSPDDRPPDAQPPDAQPPDARLSDDRPCSAHLRPSCTLSIDLTGRLCVIVGGGTLAARRANSLLDGGATVRVIAPRVCPAVETLAQKSASITIVRRPYADGDLRGAFLAVASAGVEAVDAAVRDEATRLGCLFNAATDSLSGDTTVPAVLRRGRLEVTVSTSGASPQLAGRIRREIEDAYGAEWAEYLDALASVRELVHKHVADAERRRRLLDRAADADLAGLAMLVAHTEVAAGGAGGNAGAPDDDSGTDGNADAASDESGLESLLAWLEGERRPPAPSRVALVGAGPGDPGLITTKGLARVRSADIVIYDHLVASELIAQAPAHAERIYVGKRGGHDYITQPQINEFLLAKVREAPGRLIVRLKGGDPFVFGRGGEEALVLAEADIPFEVVPGVSAGSAVPAAAGIPITHRGLSASATLVTGHEDPSKPTSDVDWELLGGLPGTLCIFMGVHNAAKIAEGLMAGGRRVDEPVAVICRGATPDQCTLVTTLGALAADIGRHGIKAPAMIVVGAVVGLRERLGGRAG
ncbi:MAG: uroporphyrinogen-III C-methyltransferase [Coriobacteriia bacterium]|nr:uroporphyrinogen-III C-methyltransferase [Coriobacteriia bacterium]